MELEWMSRDCEILISRLAAKGQKTFTTRAAALPAVVRMLGYKIIWSDDVPDDVFGYTHFDHRQIVLAKDLRDRLEFPEAFGGFLNATIAHELGHIRMHANAALRGKRELAWENEAYTYSCAFLVPFKEVMSEPECRLIRAGLLQGQETLWKQVLRLADIYQVSGAFMASALQRYGVIKFDTRRRTIKPCTVLVRKRTRLPRLKYFSVHPNECLLGQRPGRGGTCDT
jgi:hypothetical protein